LIELVELQASVDEARREIAQIADLLSAQPDAPQRDIVELGDRRGSGNRAAGKQRREPSEDGRRSFRGELLAGNGADESGEVILPLSIGHAARALLACFQ